jgi:hypothetical protein
MTPVEIDLNDLFPPKTGPEGVAAKLQSWDTAIYKDCDIVLTGCSPTWAHLLVAGKLWGIARSLAFHLDDGKSGKVIPFFPPAQ